MKLSLKDHVQAGQEELELLLVYSVSALSLE